MDTRDIATLQKILAHKEAVELAELLSGSESEIDSSDQYGTYWNSLISSFIIYAPIENFYKLKALVSEKAALLLEAILDLYQPAPGEPEIKTIEYRILKETGSVSASKQTYIGRTSRVFISYSTEDKILAGKIKRGLEDYGLEVFLAHEDIDPASEWQEVIWENLESTDIFIPLLTENFHGSRWTDQESGIALSKEKLIVPISINGNQPYGFLGKFQSLKIDPRPLSIDCDVIIKAIMKIKPAYENQILDSLIKSFVDSGSFVEAKLKTRLLLNFTTFTDQQLNEIFRGAATNRQIYESFGAQSNIKTLFMQNKNRLEPNIQELMKEKYYTIEDPDENLF